MRLKVIRKYRNSEYTIGKLYIDDVYFSDTLEDADRQLASSMPLSEISSIKVKDKTAIPTGVYKITLDVYSPSFGSRDFYKKTCNGKVPRLLNVPGFLGVLIHCGSNSNHTSGCILIGKNKIKGGLVESKETFEKLYQHLQDSYNKGEEITIEIV